MSGRFVVSVAAVFNKRIRATASFYGVDIITKEKDSPHLLAKKLKENYIWLSLKKIFGFLKKYLIRHVLAFSDLKIKSKVEIYKGTDHGFAFPERSTYNKKAALKHWKKLINLFNNNLKINTGRCGRI